MREKNVARRKTNGAIAAELVTAASASGNAALKDLRRKSVVSRTAAPGGTTFHAAVTAADGPNSYRLATAVAAVAAAAGFVGKSSAVLHPPPPPLIWGRRSQACSDGKITQGKVELTRKKCLERD